MPDKKPAAPAESPARLSSLDRPAEVEAEGSANPTEPREASMWKLLLVLRPLLPYLARLVPVLEMAVSPLQKAGLSSDVRKAVIESHAESAAKLQSAQRDLSNAIDRQSTQLVHVEDELTRLRQASEKFAAAQVDISRSLDRLGKLARLSAIALAVLLIALVIMTAIVLAHLPR